MTFVHYLHAFSDDVLLHDTIPRGVLAGPPLVSDCAAFLVTAEVIDRLAVGLLQGRTLVAQDVQGVIEEIFQISGVRLTHVAVIPGQYYKANCASAWAVVEACAAKGIDPSMSPSVSANPESRDYAAGVVRAYNKLIKEVATRVVAL
jgi:hypothetical protein